MKTEAFTYCIKIWLSAAVIAPVIMWFADKISHSYGFQGSLDYLFILLFSGLILSIPVLIAFWLLAICLLYTQLNKIFLKIILSLIAIYLVILPFLVLTENKFDVFCFLLPYLLVITSSIWFYQFPARAQTVNRA
jgi:hypothetical protein